MTEPFISHHAPSPVPPPVQTSAQDDATLDRIEDQLLADAADHLDRTHRQALPDNAPLSVRAQLANAEVGLASDRIAKLLAAPTHWQQVKQELIDLKAATTMLETIVQRMSFTRTTEG